MIGIVMLLQQTALAKMMGKSSSQPVLIKTEYKLRFQLLYNSQTLGEFSVLTFEAQHQLALNFIELFETKIRLRIFRIVPFFIMESGDPECNSGFCSEGHFSADVTLIRHKMGAISACSSNGSRIGTGFYFEMGRVDESDPVFGFVSEGFDTLQMAERLQAELEGVLGDLEMEFEWWGESDGYVSW